MEDKFEFNEGKHVYTLNGKKLYGVTSVLGVIAKPALIQWSAKMAAEYIRDTGIERTIDGVHYILTQGHLLEEAKSAHRKKKEDAGKKGTDIHAQCEVIIKHAIAHEGGCLPPSLFHADPLVQKFIDWAIENKVQFLASEKKMYSREMWVAGTCDFTCIINGKRIMGDIKTSSGIYGRDYFLQCAGYILMSEEHGEKYDGSIIVRLGKDGSFETKESWDLETDKKGFISALNLFKVLEQ